MASMRPHSAKHIVHFADEPTFNFTPEALYKIQCYVEECDKEVGWLGRVRKDKDSFLCDEVFLLHQEVAAATTELTADGLVKLLEEIGFDENETLRLWGHSHVNMGVSPSGQDQTQMQLFLDNGCAWFFRIICNKRGEIGVTFFNWEHNYYIEDMQWGITTSNASDAVRDAIKAEIAEKVKPLYSSYGRGSGAWVWDIENQRWMQEDKKKRWDARGVGGPSDDDIDRWFRQGYLD